MKMISGKRIISVLLSLLMIISALPFTPITSAAADDDLDEAREEYEYYIKVKTTDDADGWNWAYAQFYTFDDDSYSSSSKEKEYEFKSSIDDEGESFETYFRSKKFLDRVVIKIDFGGGFTWHDWEGDLTVKINGTNVITSHMACESTPFSSSNRSFSNRILSNKYPRIDEDESIFYTQSAGRNKLSRDLTFYQGEDEEKGTIQGKLYAQLVDQYGVAWKNPEKIELVSNTHPREDIFEFSHVSNNKAVFNVTSTFGGTKENYYASDHLSQVILSCPWQNPDKSHLDGTDDLYTQKLNINFKNLHDISVLVNKEPFASYREYAGKVLTLNEFNVPTGYWIKSFTKKGAGEVVDNKDNTGTFTVGNGDTEIKANKEGITYYIDYDKNSPYATGETQSTPVTYDKASVSIRNCNSTYEGYYFVGWNTQPDGSGQFFAGGAPARKPNLTTVNGGHVTLYAQWGRNILTVTLKYPAETGHPNRTFEIEHYLSVEPEEYLDVNSASGHYTYTGTDRDLSRITEDVTANLSYVKEEHQFGEAYLSVEPTCTTDGVETQACVYCGYEKNTVIPASHQDIRFDEGYPASCETNGAETVAKCYACGEIVEDGDAIPAYGHDYNFKKVSWSFSTDSGELKGWATVTCKNDKTHKITKEAFITKTDKTYDFTAYLDDYEVNTSLRIGKDIFTVNVTSTDGGTVRAVPSVAFRNDTVNLVVNHDSNRYLTGLTAMCGSNTVELEGYSFIMPKGNVEVEAEFSDLAPNQVGDNAFWYYDEITQTLTIAGTGPMYDYEFGHSPWEKRENSYVRDFRKVVIEDGITYIGENTFTDNRNPFDVYMADSVTEIGRRAFFENDRLRGVRLSNNLEKIGDNAFKRRTVLFSIQTIPASIKYIGANAFDGCDPYTEICLYANPDDLTWGDARSSFASGNKTRIVVYSEYLSTYQEKFGDTVRCTFVGGLEYYAHNINIGESEHGTVWADYNAVQNYQSVRMFAQPDEGYGLSRYVVTDSDGASVSVSGDEFSMPNKDVTVTGVFTPLYDIEIETPDGRGIAAPSKTRAIEGDTVKITTSPDLEYYFEAITVTDKDGNEYSANGDSFIMPATDVTVSVTFAEYSHKINAAVDGPGTVSGNMFANAGDTVNLKVSPDIGAKLKTIHIIDEYGNSIETDRYYSFTMPDCDVDIFADFEAIEYRITYQASNGTVTGKGTAVYGEEVKVSATPDEGYILNSVTVSSFSDYYFNKNSSSFIMPDRDVTVSADFGLEPYKISYGNMTNGTVNCEDLTPEPGTSVTVTANPDRGYYLSRLSVVNPSGNYIAVYDGNKFNMPNSDVTINAQFSKISYPIIDKSKNGKIQANATGEAGNTINCKLIPDEDYRFSDVSVKDIFGNDVESTVYTSSGAQYCRFTMPYGAAIVSAVFEQDEYSITYNNGEHGAVSGPEKGVNGKNIFLSVDPDEGYILKSLSIKTNNNRDVAYNSDYSFTMPKGNVTVNSEYVTNKCGDNAYWKYDMDTKTVTIYGSGDMYDYSGNDTPWYGFDINRVVIDIGISKVGAYAFYQTGIESIYMADSIEYIGGYAFYGSHSLTSVRMSERLYDIGTYAFAYCDALTQLEFPATLVYVHDGAFSGTTSMENIRSFMTTYDQLIWGDSSPHLLDEFKPDFGTTIHVAGALRHDCQKYYYKKINAGFYYGMDYYDVNITPNSFGTVKADFDKASEGRFVHLTVTPVDTYSLASLTVTDANGDPIELTNNTFIMPDGEVTVSAEYERATYSIAVATPSNGKFTCADSAVWGTSVPMTVTPEEGYVISDITVTDVNGNDVAVKNNAFTMPAANTTVSVEFEKQHHGITYRPTVNGSISGPETADDGDPVAITVIPEWGYKLSSLIVQTIDDEDVELDGTRFIMPDKPVAVRAVFKKIDYKVNYKVTGNGKVTGANSAYYNDEVELTVTENAGAVLESICVKDSNGDEIELTDNTFTMPEGNVTVTAKFSSNNYNITYGEAEHGTISGYTTAVYGSSITVNATPEAGYVLDTLTVKDEENNEIAVKGTSFSMPESDVTVLATFKPALSKIVYVKTANGTVSGPEKAEYGDEISISPIAAKGSRLVSKAVNTLSGDEITLTGNTFTMPDVPVVVRASFEKIDYPITYNVSQGGTVTGAEIANYGDEVELTVSVDTGYYLDELTVTDADENEVNVENNSFTMPDSAASVNAVFKKIDYTITYPETEQGTVTGVSTANYGDEVTLNITPDEHSELDSLSVKDGDNNEITVTNGKFTMPASNVTISAAFINTHYSVTYLPAEHGSVTGAETVSHGDSVALNIVSEIGYELETLTVTDGNGEEVAVSSNSFTMPESNAIVQASFVISDYAINYSETENGTVTGAALANYGDEVELTFTPDDDYAFDSVTVTDNEGNSVEVSDNRFIMPASPVNVTVTFAKCYAYAVYDSIGKTLTFKYGTHVPAGNYVEWEIPSDNNVPWNNYNSQYITDVVFDPSFAEARPTTTANWFYGFNNLNNIEGIEYLNTSEVTDMSRMFMYCYSLTSVDVSHFDTSKVTNMGEMFSNCQNLLSLDLSGFNTSNVTNMSKMFNYSINLKTLDLSFFDTSKSPDVSRMFCDCQKLETIYVEGIDTQWQASNATDIFYYCKSIVGGTGRTYDSMFAYGIYEARANDGFFTAKTHNITLEDAEGGTFEADKMQAAMNETVTLTANPDNPEMIPDYTVIDANGNEIEVVDDKFIMPVCDVTVSATFHYITYTVEWVVGGNVVETDETIKDRIPEFNGVVEQRYSDGDKTYEFFGWNDGTTTYAADELPAATDDVTYTAVYYETVHSFSEPEWSWADDYSSATATFTCENEDCAFVQTVDADVTFNGSETHPQYTAAVTYDSKEYTETVGVKRNVNVYFRRTQRGIDISGIVGETVEFEPDQYETWKDKANFEMSYITVTNRSGEDITLDITFNNQTGKYSFVMPNEDVFIRIWYNQYRGVETGNYEHGKAIPDKNRACDGELITYTTQVDDGWKLEELYYSYRYGSGTTHLSDAVQDENDKNIWYLIMPDDQGAYEGLYAVFSQDENWHTITIEETEHGTVSYERSGAGTGDEVTLTVTPDSDYKLVSLTVTDADDNEITVENNKFTMPASNVTVAAEFDQFELVERVEPYINENGEYIPGIVEHYVDKNGNNYAVGENGELGNKLDSVELTYFEFNLLSNGTYQVAHYTGPTAELTELVIPKSYNGKNITVVGTNDSSKFYETEKTQFTLVLNENITTIEQYTFYTLWVTRVTGNTSALSNIGKYAFSWANSPGGYSIVFDLDYNGTVSFPSGSLNNMNATFNLKHCTNLSFSNDWSSSKTYNFTDAHNYGEPVWSWSGDYCSATATFTCPHQYCKHQETVNASIEKQSDGRTFVATATLDENDYTDTMVKEEALNAYNLTLEDGIKVNFYIDMPYYLAEGGHIEYSYLETTDDKSASRTTYTANDEELELMQNGTRKLSLKAAPAQIAEEYSIDIYNAAGEKVTEEPIVASISDYCEIILENDAYADYQDVAQSLLNYGALADEYFGYAALSEAVTGKSYAVPHSENYKAAVDAESFKSKAHASIVQGNVQITGVSYVALLNPEFRFYVSNLTEAQAASINVDVDREGLTVQTVKTDNGICVKVTGLMADEFEKTFTLTIGTTQISYNGYAYLYTVISNDKTEDNLKNLAKGVYRYAAACEAKFA